MAWSLTEHTVFPIPCPQRRGPYISLQARCSMRLRTAITLSLLAFSFFATPYATPPLYDLEAADLSCLANRAVPIGPLQQFEYLQQPHQLPQRQAGNSSLLDELNAEPLKRHDRTGFSPQQAQVVEAMKWAWNHGYVQYAFGEDLFLPLSQGGSAWNGYGIGLSILDSLDPLYLMGMMEEFEQASQWCREKLTFDLDVYVNLFETTIRGLGGLLSAFALTGDHMFLSHAEDLGSRLSKAFSSPSAIPYSDVNLRTGAAKAPEFTSSSSTSEVATIQLEFQYLSLLLADDRYRQLVDNASDALASLPKLEGLVPIFINPDSGSFNAASTITFGARGDSYYEYLLKQCCFSPIRTFIRPFSPTVLQWLLGEKKVEKHKERYMEAMTGMVNKLLRRSEHGESFLYLAELSNSAVVKKMDHLVCFLPGLLALGHYHGLGHQHLETAEHLMHTCYKMYKATPSGLAPEIVYFDEGQDMSIHPADAFNLGRPETVESLFILHRVTANPKYRDWGWEIFEAFEKHAKVPTGGYCALENLLSDQPKCRDVMESFFLAETLKYFFLLYSDDPSLLPLHQYVFNTEAHPLPITPMRL